MAKLRDVVITGVGVVSPIGIGFDNFARSLAMPRGGVGAIQSFDASELPVRIAAEVRDFEPKDFVRPRKSLKVMSRDIQLGFAAAAMAREHAGISDDGSIDPDRTGVILGGDMMYCDIEEIAAAFRACARDGRMEFARWGQYALGELNPLWLLKYLPNMPACHVAIASDYRGPNNTIVNGDVSSLLAINEAASVIERGLADVMLSGGASARIHPSVFAFRGDNWASRRNEEPASACRPFDISREGLVHGEGAAIFVLEASEHAEKRRAKQFGRLLGFGSAFANRPQDMISFRSAVKRSIEIALKKAKLTPSDVGHVNANGLGTRPHDEMEAAAIAETLGSVPVTAPKSYFGNAEGASGAMELAASLLAIKESTIPVTLNHEKTDPRCPIQVVHGRAVPLAKATAIVLNQDIHGQAVALVMGMDR